jgi:hypothetical protein
MTGPWPRVLAIKLFYIAFFISSYFASSQFQGSVETAKIDADRHIDAVSGCGNLRRLWREIT